MILVSILILVVYSILILSFIIGFDAIDFFDEKTEPKNEFSIIVPFRNEEKNLPRLLQSFSNLKYPKHLFEVLLVNDYSQDSSVKIIDEFILQNPQLNIQLLKNKRASNSPKKNAIKTAVKTAKFNWLITTDADCELHKNWLETFNSFIEKKQPYFIAAPVVFKTKKTFLAIFQQLNLTSLIGSTIGSFGINKPIMCNGANLCYRKDIFIKIKGFEGNSKIASGDDVFLLEKMVKKYPEKVMFLKSNNALVKTKTENTWKAFYNQQLRWASKSSAYENKFSQLISIFVFLQNFVIILLLISLLFTTNYWLPLAISLIVKFFIDSILISKTEHLLNVKSAFFHYILSSLCYPFFVSTIGLLAQFNTYTWKERNYKK
ncbi:Glycosyltransferase, catalytic subunit of cellulose synthase and poly-beta-1,6-N-acetylglucosamine synthase [Lutibacter oricola]|uniref:Glycosyltransferase, catalytic subunit of cellulose synthase and poly-beta-1,6-N-acetylglucosamine synthase n=1 Tax=Lutibacter oricola TaxID=762486 RepID=A0A1H2U1T4_9FLAO|nr:glycosyltransferase [Lutibacter oricola]SDW50192.1 Glycosyltransferase, catalytic subunit of cellulose synthase and poly-beta-1,6-N-acetylglucosamine synthase [Lutibacter oricola]